MMEELKEEISIERAKQLKQIANELASYSQKSKDKIDAELKDVQAKSEARLAEANKKYNSIIADANYQAEGIRGRAENTKVKAEDELTKAKKLNEDAINQMKWVESRAETIRLCEKANNTILDFLKDQLSNVKKLLANVSGLMLSSTSFLLSDNSIVHNAYTLTNTNPYPVIAKSSDFDSSFEAYEELLLPTDNNIVRDFVTEMLDGKVEVTPVNLSPEIRKKNRSADIDIDW